MKKSGELDIRGTVVRVVKISGEDFVCLTDMAKLKSEDAQQTISNWMRNRMTLEYLGLWEELYNPDFKPLGFEGVRKEVELNHIHTDAIKENLIPAAVSRAQMNITYASEADVLNVALFGTTHQKWQTSHPDLMGNQRDYATINQLVCISNMENINAVGVRGNALCGCGVLLGVMPREENHVCR